MKQVVYFIRGIASNRVKIGFAKDVEGRLARLQTGSPDDLELLGVIGCENPRLAEKALHRRFAVYRSRGEWFTYSEELRAFIERCATKPEIGRRQLRRRGGPVYSIGDLEMSEADVALERAFGTNAG